MEPRILPSARPVKYRAEFAAVFRRRPDVANGTHFAHHRSRRSPRAALIEVRPAIQSLGAGMRAWAPAPRRPARCAPTSPGPGTSSCSPAATFTTEISTAVRPNFWKDHRSASPPRRIGNHHLHQQRLRISRACARRPGIPPAAFCAAPRIRHHRRGVQRQQRCRQIGGRRAVRHVAAHGRHVADLHRAAGGRRAGQKSAGQSRGSPSDSSSSAMVVVAPIAQDAAPRGCSSRPACVISIRKRTERSPSTTTSVHPATIRACPCRSESSRSASRTLAGR